jgi:6-pyruvoyltetrahydropterin/6-carboxytetrahydropterin synthase
MDKMTTHLIEQVFTRRIAIAHRLISDPLSPCYSIHGHNVYIKWHAAYHATMSFTLDFEANMLAPFAKVKGTIHKWMDNYLDHSLFISNKDSHLPLYLEDKMKMAVFHGDPTMEMVAASLYAKINAFLSDSFELKLYCPMVEIEETPTNTVIVRSSFNLPKSCQHWWNRADMTTNDNLAVAIAINNAEQVVADAAAHRP